MGSAVLDRLEEVLSDENGNPREGKITAKAIRDILGIDANANASANQKLCDDMGAAMQRLGWERATRRLRGRKPLPPLTRRREPDPMPRYDKEQIARMTNEALDAAILETRTALARADARIEMLSEFAARDPATAEALRIAAWAKAGRAEAHIPEGATEPVLTAPDGWPEGVDAAGALDDLLGNNYN